MRSSSIKALLASFSQQGRSFLSRYTPFVEATRSALPADGLVGLSKALLSVKGEASGIAIASDILAEYQEADEITRGAFFAALAAGFGPDPQRLLDACAAYSATPTAENLQSLTAAVESPRRELFRRLNLAPEGTARLVAMRGNLLSYLTGEASLTPVDDDFHYLLQSWFNRGFLEMRRLSWSSPADILERVIRYEAVHSIRDWNDLRSRLDPPDRRCFAFFHPAMPDEPLIFVEVALTVEMPENIQSILDPARAPIEVDQARCAVFYSISNCQKGMQGVSFGNFLIKQVVAELSRELPSLRDFVTLSPVPGFMQFLRRTTNVIDVAPASNLASADVELLGQPGWWENAAAVERLRGSVMAFALRYFLEEKDTKDRPIDPVARFHLGNGARLERINWLGDTSDNGLQQSGGLMVNYLYDLADVAENHEAYAHRGTVATGKPLLQLVKSLKAALAEKREDSPPLSAEASARISAYTPKRRSRSGQHGEPRP